MIFVAMLIGYAMGFLTAFAIIKDHDKAKFEQVMIDMEAYYDKE